jgi:glyoxylase-like metal-dependent hydrolase (beta-lactamase superfamily II)
VGQGADLVATVLRVVGVDIFQVADGLWCQRSDRWQTNSAIAVRDGHVVVCDPSWTAAEITAIAATAAARGPRGVTVLVTHADEDHVCGIGAFPHATVLAGVATARDIADGRAADRLATARATWGLSWVGAPFTTGAVEPGACSTGPFRLTAIEAAGHATEGTAWLLVDDGVLLPGDYLSAVSPPLVLGSIAGFRATLARLLDVLERGHVAVVVPGHGPALARSDALAVGRADLAYLDLVTAAATEAVADHASAGDALVAAWLAAEPPRAAIADLAIYDPRTLNARAAVIEAERAAGGR